MSTISPQPLPSARVRPLALPTSLPREIIAALTRWQNLRKGAWLIADAAEVLNGLSYARTLAFDSGREALARALDALSLYLGFLLDGDALVAQPKQLQRLARLEESILVLLRAERGLAVVPDERKLIVLLAPTTPLWQAIVARLDAARYRVERYAEPAQLFRRSSPAVPAAVLIDQQFLSDLHPVTQHLENAAGPDALGSTVLYFNRSRDADARSRALADGADTSLEGEDIDHLVTRVIELIKVRERQDNLRVLIVEDDRSQAMYCEVILRKQGVDVKVAIDAHQAITAIHEFAPDLVLMDLHMPQFDGLQLTGMIRDDPRLSLLPVIFLTGEQDEGTRFNALRVGGDDYLVKPVTPRHLVTAVVSRAQRARNLKQQFAGCAAEARKPRLVQTGEFISTLRSLGLDRSCHQALMLCAPDHEWPSGKHRHDAATCELQFQIAKQVEHELADDERVAPWPDGGYLLLVEKTADAELLMRAEAFRQQIATAMRGAGAADVSLAIVPLPTEKLPSAESLLDLAERTLDIARHAGGVRVQRALAELPSDLPAELTLEIQKALSRPPSASTIQILYQPIVALHGAQRPQYQMHISIPIGANGERRATRLQWLDLARQIGCCRALDLYAVDQALDCIQSTRKALPGLRVFVAVDASSVIDPAFLGALSVGLAKRHLSDPGLVLSIDHSEAMLVQTRMQAARAQLEMARVLLCFGRVGIDARGREVIEALRPEILAVDATALRAAPQTPAILSFAHARGAELIAHFIPDSQTLARAFALGVDYGIGNFVGAPRARLDYDFGDH